MGKIICVTGGSRSGKSEYAEKLLEREEDVLYIATAIVTDDEMRQRIEKHKERRNHSWRTYEGYKDLKEVIAQCEEKVIMLDCITVMVTNLMFEVERDFDNMKRNEVQELQDDIKKQIEHMVLEAIKREKTLVMVTNEVGYGLVPEYKLGRIFRDIAGIINQAIAALSNEVYLVACGLPLRLK